MKIVTFGEIMLRLAPPSYERFLQSPRFEATFGGGEANVSVSLARFGRDAAFVTKLPAHAIGDAAVGELRRHGVDTSLIVRGGNRVGIYYCEKGASQRPSKVIYDRKHSAIAEAAASDFDWDRIFDGVGWFHVTGITPALSAEAAAITLEACKKAREKGIEVSCDLNYRKNLWTPAEAGKVMGEIMKYVTLLIGNEEDAEKVFGISAQGTDVNTGTISHDGYIGVAQELSKRFGIPRIAITLRESHSASDNGWGAMLWDKEGAVFSRKFDIHIVDRVGGGDSFAAGLIDSILAGSSKETTINFAVAASCLKHTIEGDFNLSTKEEVLALAKGDGSGRVQR